jgi:hypothetical protein
VLWESKSFGCGKGYQHPIRWFSGRRTLTSKGFTVEYIMQDELFEGAQPRVFVTNPDNLDEGRTFVWAKARWYERLEGEMGNVAFSPITDS